MAQQPPNRLWNDLMGPRPEERYERPSAAAALSILGGAFVVVSGGVIAATGLGAQSLAFGADTGAFVAIGIIEVILGLLIVFFGVFVYASVRWHIGGGTVIVVLSAFALAGLGGSLLGGVLGVIGGVLAIVYTPPEDRPAAARSLPRRVCLHCGWMRDADARACPHCGHDPDS